MISSVSASPSQTSAQITWTTDETASSSVEYGTTNNYGSTATGTDGSTAHSVSLSNLTCNTTYDYQVTSVDADSNSNSSANGMFTTSPCTAPQVVAAGIISSGGYLKGFGPVAVAASTVAMPPFLKNLKKGMIDPDVIRLQKFLNGNGDPVTTDGAGSAGHETTLFGSLTKKALMKFQNAHNLVPDGFFGPKSRAAVNAIQSQ